VHEISIATQLVELVMQHLPDRGVMVTSLRLRIGELSCVHGDALRFGFELVTAGTPLQGAALQIDTVPVSIYCTVCGSVETIESIQDFCCPHCQTPSADIRFGQELDLESIEVIEVIEVIDQKSKSILH
jgi:hydrogenase nickel incorporation protein HypA/HybF